MAHPAAPVSSIFDAHHPPAQELISDCVHCGFCLQTCPTYQLWHEEMDSPRGRIYLMKMGLEGGATIGPKYVAHFDKCLGCMACMPACPSGVKYDKLIEATRAQIERNYRRPFADRFFRRLIFALFPHPRRLRLVLPFLWAYQHLGLRSLLRRSGLLNAAPRWRAMEALLPEVSLRRESLPLRLVPEGVPRRRVGLMLGCVQRVFFDDVNAATARVLVAEGCEVVIPHEQGCCGALMTHAGRERDSLNAARNLIDTFETTDVDCIVINAAGCGSNLKEYGHLLRDDPQYAMRAAAFAAKCKDITEVLTELQPRARRHPVEMRVAYQDSCHLQHAQGVRTAPRQLLASIPGLELVEVAEAPICCGSAGIYNLVEPIPAGELGERKARHVIAAGADALVSGNPGCLMQITTHLAALGRPMPSFHTVQLLDASIRGVQLSPRRMPSSTAVAKGRAA